MSQAKSGSPTDGVRIDPFNTPVDTTTPEEDQTVEQLVVLAMSRLSIESTLEHMLACAARVKVSELAPTAAVCVAPDGLTELHINETFLRELGYTDFVFVLAHEAYHLLYEHLRAGVPYRKDPLFQLACEVVINHRVRKHLRRDLPRDSKGEKSGVDPDKVYNQYKKAVDDPVSKDKFLESDVSCMHYLRQMPKPPKVKQHFCTHVGEEAGGVPAPGLPDLGDADEGVSNKIDPAVAESIVSEVLGTMVQDALNGDNDAKAVLLDLEQSVPDSKTWGTLGLGRLRGEKVRTRNSPLWEMALRRFMGSKLLPGNRLAYNKKLPGYKMLFPCGKEPQKKFVCYTDTSGSMSNHVIERFQKIQAEIPGATGKYYWFDAEVQDADGAGEGGSRILGGGGTSFQCIVEHVEALDEEPDAVIVITDGYAPHVKPRNGDDWVWIIVPGGDAWPSDAGMQTIVVDDDFSQLG